MEKEMRPGRNGGKLKTGGAKNAGRPKKIPAIDELLADVMGDEKDGMSAARAILLRMCKMAKNGNLRAAELLLDRAYGKPRQTIDAVVETKKTEYTLPDGTKIEL